MSEETDHDIASILLDFRCNALHGFSFSKTKNLDKTKLSGRGNESRGSQTGKENSHNKTKQELL